MIYADNIMKEVADAFPSLSLIENVELRNKVIEAWCFALKQNNIMHLTDIPSREERDFGVTLAKHTEGVVRLSVMAVESLEKTTGYRFKYQRDILVAGALLHDIGKLYEFNPENKCRWSDRRIAGIPAIRHSFYSGHIAMEMGMPEEIIHICYTHETRFEGGFRGRRSFYSTLIRCFNDFYWRVLESADPFTALDNTKIPYAGSDELQYEIADDLRTDILAAIPDIKRIGDRTLMEKTITVWALALTENDYDCVEALPKKSDVGDVVVSDEDHTAGIVRMSEEAKRIIEETSGHCLQIDDNMLLCAAILHDAGKAVEWRNKARWAKTGQETGSPSYRHHLYGAHLAMKAGVPEDIVATIYNHTDDPDSPSTEPSPCQLIITLLDRYYWDLFKSAMPD